MSLCSALSFVNYWNSRKTPDCNIQLAMEILRKSKQQASPQKKTKHNPTKNMSCNFFLISLYLSWSLPQNNQSYIDTGTGQFLWFFFKFKNKEPSMNCQEGFFYQYVLLLTPFAFYRNTHVFLSSLILLKAGRLSLRGARGVFSPCFCTTPKSFLVKHLR